VSALVGTPIPVRRLARHCNPFSQSPWGTKVRRTDVRRALDAGDLEPQHNTDRHAQRIAYLVANEASDPIEVDVGIPALQHHVGWMVLDGNHRLAAAIYAGRETILAQVGGQLDYAESLFGVDCTLNPGEAEE